MKTLITATCLCVIGWTAYFVGNTSIDRLRQLQAAHAAADITATMNKAWSDCMDRMYQPPQVTTFELRNELCERAGYLRP